MCTITWSKTIDDNSLQSSLLLADYTDIFEKKFSTFRELLNDSVQYEYIDLKFKTWEIKLQIEEPVSFIEINWK